LFLYEGRLNAACKSKDHVLELPIKEICPRMKTSIGILERRHIIDSPNKHKINVTTNIEL
jgi:hypothetical protein